MSGKGRNFTSSPETLVHSRAYRGYGEPFPDNPDDLLFLHILLPFAFLTQESYSQKVSHDLEVSLCLASSHVIYVWWAPSGRKAGTQFNSSTLASCLLGNSGSKAREGSLLSCYRQVHNSNNVFVPQNMRATARVDVNGLPANEACKWIVAQDVEAEKAKRNPRDDYTMVYIPPSLPISPRRIHLRTMDHRLCLCYCRRVCADPPWLWRVIKPFH